MISTRVLTALALAVLAIAAPAARAQYMYLDSNGNGVHDSGDQLAANGSPTTVDVWLDTNHNRDGSVATCDVDPTASMGLTDYYVNFQTSGGQATYSGFVTHHGNPPIGEFNPGDGIRYGNGLVGGFTTVPPGLYRIATLTITGTTGTPQVQIVDLLSGHPDYTMFSPGPSGCFGNDFDNVLKLTGSGGGTDWTDVDGLGPVPTCLDATAFTTNGNKQINLGKQAVCVQIQPANGSFTIQNAVLASIVMSSQGTGSVSEIPADAGKTTLGGDKNGDGIQEITACFRKEDVQQLFSGLSGTQSVTVALKGNVSGGGKFCASTTLTIKAGGGGGLTASISPNPLNPSAVLMFTTSRAGAVKVQLFDTHGRLIQTLMDQSSAAAGYHDVHIDGRDAGGDRLASGVYYLKIQSVDGTLAKAVTILK